MLRLVYVILISLPFVIYYLVRSNYMIKHLNRYSEHERYHMVKRMIEIMKRNGRIETQVFGTENLPQEGGYVMYSNHQGKYDALGIISAHENPCSFVIDEKRAGLPMAREFTELLEACKLDREDIKKQVKAIGDIVDQVRKGRRFIIFPEGKYNDAKSNDVIDFMPGTFKCSVKSRTPIIPVAIKDSYKVYGINSLRKVKTEVHFLKPIHYEEYENLTTKEIAKEVHDRISNVMKPVSAE